MPCYTPIMAWYGERTEKGKRKLTFDRTKATGVGIEISCGKCIGCRLERSRQWAVRCMHEASMHMHNCFITLTYDGENLPKDEGLVKDDFQKFIKRLRQFCNRRANGHVKIKYFGCGEYGDANGRPHYHALIFGYDFSHDRKEHSEVRSQEGFLQWKSPSLEKLWGKGITAIGTLTFESAAYVARYCVKKIYGEKAEEHYNGKEPEFALMSKKTPIGYEWLERYKSDVEKNHTVAIRGRKVIIPRYYKKFLEKDDEEKYNEVKKTLQGEVKYKYPAYLRLAEFPVTKEDCEEERQKVKMECKKSQLKTLRRRLETP